MRRPRRDFQVFSLSFLDVICCGFGAIILLLVLTKFGEPLAIEEARQDLDRLLIELEAELYEIRGETAILDRRLRGGAHNGFVIGGPAPGAGEIDIEFNGHATVPRLTVSGTRFRSGHCLVPRVIGLDDTGNEGVPDDVLVAEPHG